MLILCIAGFAALSVVVEKPAAAALLFGALSAQIETNQITVELVDQIEIDQYLELCRAQVEKAVFDQAWNAGRAMTLKQAMAYAQKSVN